MPAGMHDRHHVAGDRVLLHHLRCVFQTGLFLHRQAIHIRPHHHHGAVTVFQHGDDTGTAHPFGDVKAGVSQLPGHACRSLVLYQRKLRIAVKMIEQHAQVGVVVGLDGLAEAGSLAADRCCE